MKHDKTIYTIPEAAKKLGISQSSAYRLVEKGSLKCHKWRRTSFIKADTIDQYLSSIPEWAKEIDRCVLPGCKSDRATVTFSRELTKLVRAEATRLRQPVAKVVRDIIAKALTLKD